MWWNARVWNLQRAPSVFFSPPRLIPDCTPALLALTAVACHCPAIPNIRVCACVQVVRLGCEIADAMAYLHPRLVHRWVAQTGAIRLARPLVSQCLRLQVASSLRDGTTDTARACCRCLPHLWPQ
eukprot:364605-Chlamydomonas_euryale.AAC.4